MARNKKQNDAGKKLRQTDQPEIERPLGNFIDLPADSNSLHFRGNHNKKTRRLKFQKSGIAESGARVCRRLRLYGWPVTHRPSLVEGSLAVRDPNIFHLVSVLQIKAALTWFGFEQIRRAAFIRPDLF